MSGSDDVTFQRLTMRFETRFMQVRNEWVRDKRIAGLPLNVFLFIQSQAPGFEFKLSYIQSQLGIGREKLRRAMNVLEENGYLERFRERRADGTLGGMFYSLRDPVDAERTTAESPAGVPIDGQAVETPESSQSLPVPRNPSVGKDCLGTRNQDLDIQALADNQHKKNNLKNNKKQEHHRVDSDAGGVGPVAASAGEPPLAADDDSSLRHHDQPTSPKPAPRLQALRRAAQDVGASKPSEVELVRAAVEQRLGGPLPVDVDLAAAIRDVSSRATRPVSNRVRWLAAAIARSPDAWRRTPSSAPHGVSCRVTGQHRWGPAYENRLGDGSVEIRHWCLDCRHDEPLKQPMPRSLAAAS